MAIAETASHAQARGKLVFEFRQVGLLILFEEAARNRKRNVGSGGGAVRRHSGDAVGWRDARNRGGGRRKKVWSCHQVRAKEGAARVVEFCRVVPIREVERIH